MPEYLAQTTQEYIATAENVLSCDSEAIKDFKFKIEIKNLEINYSHPLLISEIKIANSVRLQLSKASADDTLNIYLIIENNTEINNDLKSLISHSITKIILNYFIEQIFPKPFIITSERTGVSLFYRELDTSRNTLVENLQQIGNINNHSELFMKRHISRYPLPIRFNMDFIRNLFDLSKNKTKLNSELKSFIAKQLSNGKYTFDKELNQIFFIPDMDKKLKLPLNTASSSIKSLLLFDAYVNFIANNNQILIIDEPELCLHPDNQRKMARFISLLVNSGIKVLFTTHSDYIVKEINNLVMLYCLESKHRVHTIAHMNKSFNASYSSDMPIDPLSINCYTIIENKNGYTAKQNKIDCYGIDLELFDDEINNLSDISQILYNELSNGKD